MFAMLFAILIIYLSLNSVISSEPPKIMPLPALPPFSEGAIFSSMCAVVKGTSPFTFEWSKYDKQISSGSSRASIENTAVGSVITIHEIRAEDSGNYTCKVRNRFGEDSYSFPVFVRTPLKWIIEPQDTFGALSQEVTINCEANGYPRPKITWIKLDNNKIVSNQEILSLNKLNPDKAGNYECIADNGIDAPLRKRILVKAFGKQITR